MKNIKVTTFGEFAISTDDARISDSDNRSKKVWTLLAYLIYNRNRTVKANELSDILYNDSDSDKGSPSALKTLFYRVRTELDKLWVGAGKELILYRNGGYVWNGDCLVEADYEKLESLDKKIRESDTDDLDDSILLLGIYQGGFLSRLSSELWIMPLATFYHNVYITHLLDALPKLLERTQYEKACEFCRTASLMDPFNEEIHCYWMQAHIALGEHKRAVDIYRKLSDRLLAELGVIPSRDTRALYHEAIKSSNEFAISVEMLQDQLKETDDIGGALVCEFDFFRVLCHSMSRSILRSGIAVHLALITMRGKKVSEHDTKRWDKLQTCLQDSIRLSLRRGDSLSRCSASQYVVLLPRANYENSCMVCERIVRAYYQKQSRLDAELRYDVFPIELDDKENLKWMNDSFAK